MPQSPIRVLFVCHGNICRSTMAEFVLKDMVARRGLTEQFHIESAATSTEEIGNPVHPGTAAVLREHGIGGFEGKRARQLRRADYDAFDFIIGMDTANIRNMTRTARCSNSWNSPAPTAASTTPGTRVISKPPMPTCAMAARGCWRIWGCSLAEGREGVGLISLADAGWQRLGGA